MITAETEVLVDRPAEEVFDFLADVRNEERWNPNVVRIESESAGPLSVGGSFEGMYRRGGRMRFELVDAVRPSRLVFRGGGRQMTLVATLEPLWNLFDLTAEGRPTDWDEQLSY